MSTEIRHAVIHVRPCVPRIFRSIVGGVPHVTRTKTCNIVIRNVGFFGTGPNVAGVNNSFYCPLPHLQRSFRTVGTRYRQCNLGFCDKRGQLHTVNSDVAYYNVSNLPKFQPGRCGLYVLVGNGGPRPARGVGRIKANKPFGALGRDTNDKHGVTGRDFCNLVRRRLTGGASCREGIFKLSR